MQRVWPSTHVSGLRAAELLGMDYSVFVEKALAGDIPAKRPAEGGQWQVDRKVVDRILSEKRRLEVQKMNKIYPQEAAAILGRPTYSGWQLVSEGLLPDERLTRGNDLWWTQDEIEAALKGKASQQNGHQKVTKPEESVLYPAEEINPEYDREWRNPSGPIYTLDQAVVWVAAPERGDLARPLSLNSLRDYTYPKKPGARGGTWKLPRRFNEERRPVLYESDLICLLNTYKNTRTKQSPEKETTMKPVATQSVAVEAAPATDSPIIVDPYPVQVDPYADLPLNVRRQIQILALLARTKGISEVVEVHAVPMRIVVEPSLLVPIEFEVFPKIQVFEVTALKDGDEAIYQVVHVEDGTPEGYYKSAEAYEEEIPEA